jgi:SAM-dependent methyltransferase
MSAPPRPEPPTDQSFTYRSFSEKEITRAGASRRGRIERARLDLLHRHIHPPGRMLEIGPGHGSLALSAVEAGWTYTAVEPSPLLAQVLRGHGLEVVEALVPPFPVDDAAWDVVYADQVLEHMSGIDAARAFTAESLRALKPGGVLFVVVPDYLKERTFFWDVDYTHNFVTTERRVRQLLYDGGFAIERVVRSIGAATGFTRDLLAASALLVNLPGVNTLSRYTRTEELLFKVRKNLFETLTFVARKPRT